MTEEVLVVGAGPVGLTMATELARYRVPVRVIEKAAARSETSKALVIWSRTLELIDRMGCADTFVSAGFRAVAANVVAGGAQIGRIALDTVDSPYPYALMLPQCETERLMELQLSAHGVRVERQVELIGFAQAPDQVSARLRHVDGREETVETPWLIGCDGAHSAVRHGLGVPFEGETLPSSWFLADVRLTGVPTPPDELAIYWHADGVLALFPISPGRYRIVADIGSAPPGSPQSDPTLEEIQGVLDARGPGDIQGSEPLWLSRFTINERKVADYRAGRVFLVGDAAHIHSPAGGQGMNTGMQDAFNLAWKLALAIRRLAAPEPLLGSYSAERSEVGRKVLADAGNLTRLAMIRGRLEQGLRNRIGSLVFGLAPVRRAMSNTMAELSIGYPKSPLTATHGPRLAGPAAGARTPVRTPGAPVGAGDAPRFALCAQATLDSAALIARHGDLLSPEIRAPLEKDGVWLVRPDGYVAATAAQGDWARIGAYLDRIAGASAGTAG